MSDQPEQTEGIEALLLSIQINNPPNLTPVPHTAFPSDGNYDGTDAPVLIECVLDYANPPAAPFSTGKLPPEDLVNKLFSRQFMNVNPTLPGQQGLLTAFLFDSSGQTLLAQSATVQLTIT
jgi:hypothetical protein